MLYAFALQRKTAALLVAGCVVVEILTFAAGLLIGAHVRSTHDLFPASLANRTLLEPNRANASMPAEGAPEARPGHAMPVSSDTSGPVATASVPLLRSEQPADEAAGRRPEASSMAAVPLPPAMPLAQPLRPFAVQVGAFVKPQGAESLSAALRQKGYRTAVVPLHGGPHTAQRLWYTVQLGQYTSRDEATQAAVIFTRQERSPALVRQREAR
jgi:cell division septation protein DedD